VIGVYEEALDKKYPHLKRKGVVKTWICGITNCCTRCCKGRSNRREKYTENDNENEAVDSLRMKMRAAREHRKNQMKANRV
jgi:hypothetical protein